MSLTQGLQLPFGIQPVNPVPVDSWSGPYDGVSLQEAIDLANSTIPIEIRFQSMEVRLIVDGIAKKFWYEEGVDDINLVELLTSSTGGATPSFQQVLIAGNTASSPNGESKTQIDLSDSSPYLEFTLKGTDDLYSSIIASKNAITIGNGNDSTGVYKSIEMYSSVLELRNVGTNSSTFLTIPLSTFENYVDFYLPSDKTTGSYTLATLDDIVTPTPTQFATPSFYIKGTTNFSFDTTSDIYRTGYLNIGSGTATNGRFVVSSSGGTVSLIVDNSGNIYNNGIGNSIFTTKFGYNALINSGLGTLDYNTAFGYNTLGSSVGGRNNTAVGISALSNLIDDYYNTAVGSNAAATLKSGQVNTAIGYGSNVGVTASGNLSIGGNAGSELTIGSYNTFLGHNSGRFVTTGSYNIILGANSNSSPLTTGSYNVILGRPTSIGATTSNSVFISDNQGNTKVKFNSAGIMNITNVLERADNAAALSSGLVIGDVYRTGDFLKIVR
jgi:hypothetical protein